MTLETAMLFEAPCWAGRDFLKDGKGKMTVAKKIKGSENEINLVPVPGNAQNACPENREQPPTRRAPLG